MTDAERLREVALWSIGNLLPEGVGGATEWEARIAANLRRVAVKGKPMIGSLWADPDCQTSAKATPKDEVREAVAEFRAAMDGLREAYRDE